MKNSYMAKFENNLENARKAMRTATYKSAVCHIAGDAYEFQYECTINSTLDGEDCKGQYLAEKLIECCTAIMNARSTEVESYRELLEVSVEAIISFLS